MDKIKNFFTKDNIIYLTIFAILLLSSYSGLVDYDYYWQSDLGKHIIKDGNFNWIYNQVWGTTGISEYYDHEWLTNILFYLSTLVGLRGITIMKIVISIFLASCVVMYIKSEDKELNDFSVLKIFIFIFILSTVFLKVKAYCISIGFVLLEIMFLKRYKKTLSNNYFIYMLILCILWNNMHSGSIILFFAIAGIYWFTDLRSNKKIPFYGIIYLLSTSINPYGYKLLLFNLAHFGDSIMKKYVFDWRGLDAKESYGVICAILIFICIVNLYNVDIKENLFDVSMTFIIIFMGLQSVRHLVYLVPFFISVSLNNNHISVSLNKSVLKYILVFFTGLATVCNYDAFTCKTYNTDYAMNYIDDELKDLLIKTNSSSSNGLFSDEVPLWGKGVKSFTSGAFPCTRQRFLDSYLMMWTGSNSQIESIIDYYGLTKFCFKKTNTLVDYYTVNCVLYEYLVNNDDYICLYDSGYYCYFVRADLEY